MVPHIADPGLHGYYPGYAGRAGNHAGGDGFRAAPWPVAPVLHYRRDCNGWGPVLAYPASFPALGQSVPKSCLMRPEDALGDAASFKQHEAQKHRVADGWI